MALTAGEGFAADLRAPVYKAPTVLPPVVDWSGFYIGVGGGWQGSRIGLSNPDFGTLTYEPHHNSGVVGGLVGVQRQFGPIVLGVEGGYLGGFGQASLGNTHGYPSSPQTQATSQEEEQRNQVARYLGCRWADWLGRRQLDALRRRRLCQWLVPV
jgi:hypothetical protein